MDNVGEYALKVMQKARWYNAWLLAFFKKYLKGEILEVGAGIGNFSNLLQTNGKVTSIDINKDYLKFPGVSNVDIGYGDIENGDYFFKDKKFDSIVCLNVIEHVRNDRKAFENVYKLLKKGGVSIILVPAGACLFSKYDKLLGHYKRYSLNSLKKMLEDKRFNVLEARYINWWGAIGWLFYMKILKRTSFPVKELSVFDVLGKYMLWIEKFVKLPFGLSVIAIVKK